MEIFTILFIILYIGCLVSYFFSETSGNFKRRVINKIILASMFFIYGIVAFSLNYNFYSYHSLLLLALTFAYIGDVLLLFSFTKGGMSFIISNLLFFIFEIITIIIKDIPFYSLIYFVILLTIIYSIFLILVKRNVLELKNKFLPISIYIFSVVLQATLSIPIAIYLNQLTFYMLSIGLVLFMISDYFLMIHTFKYPNKKWILRCNSGFYFIGLLLIVLSLMY